MIRGKHIGLRAIEPDDLEQLLFWRNQPEFRRYFREYRELSSTHQQQWYTSKVVNDPDTRMFSIVRNDGGELMGACGLCYIDWINRNADFSIYVGYDHLYVDDVYAVDAGIQLLRYGFEELAMHRIWSEIYNFDERKKRFLLRLGFTLDGCHRETHWSDGAWHDSLFYGLLEKEFSQRRIDNDHPGSNLVSEIAGQSPEEFTQRPMPLGQVEPACLVISPTCYSTSSPGQSD